MVLLARSLPLVTVVRPEKMFAQESDHNPAPALVIARVAVLLPTLGPRPALTFQAMVRSWSLVAPLLVKR